MRRKPIAIIGAVILIAIIVIVVTVVVTRKKNDSKASTTSKLDTESSRYSKAAVAADSETCSKVSLELLFQIHFSKSKQTWECENLSDVW